MGRASIIEAYLQRLLAWNQPITPAILKAIADEVGITQGELDALDLKVKAHLTRGDRHMEAGEFDQAIEELTQATELNPADLEVLLTLAYAYNLRYNQDSNLADRERALQIAKRCVELRPSDKGAQALVRGLNQSASTQSTAKQTKPNIFILISFLENIFSPRKISRRTKTKIAVLILFLQQPVHAPPVGWWLKPTMAAVAGSVATVVGFSMLGGERLPWAKESKPPEIVISDPSFDPGPNIPVTFNYPGLLIEPRLSRLGEYDGEDYYKLHGIVINDSGQDVRSLNLKVELLDGDGRPLSTINQVAVNGGIIRPGDTQSFNLFHKISPALISVRVSVTEIEQMVGNDTYAPPRPSEYNQDKLASETIRLISRNSQSEDAD